MATPLRCGASTSPRQLGPVAAKLCCAPGRWWFRLERVRASGRAGMGPVRNGHGDRLQPSHVGSRWEAPGPMPGSPSPRSPRRGGRHPTRSVPCASGRTPRDRGSRRSALPDRPGASGNTRRHPARSGASSGGRTPAVWGTRIGPRPGAVAGGRGPARTSPTPTGPRPGAHVRASVPPTSFPSSGGPA